MNVRALFQRHRCARRHMPQLYLELCAIDLKYDPWLHAIAMSYPLLVLGIGYAGIAVIPIIFLACAATGLASRHYLKQDLAAKEACYRLTGKIE